MQKIKKFVILNCAFVIVLMLLVVPVFSFAQTNADKGLIPCGRSPGPNVDLATTKPCEFKDFMTLINTVIKFILFKLVVPISAVMFFYAGFLMVTSGGSTEARGKAKNIFSNAVYGLVIAAGAWLIIRTILLILGYKGDWIGI